MRRTSRPSGGQVRNLEDPVKRGVIECSVVDHKASGVRSWPPIYILLRSCGGSTPENIKTPDYNKRQVIECVCGGAKGKRSPSVILESAWTPPLLKRLGNPLACDRKKKGIKYAVMHSVQGMF